MYLEFATPPPPGCKVQGSCDRLSSRPPAGIDARQVTVYALCVHKLARSSTRRSPSLRKQGRRGHLSATHVVRCAHEGDVDAIHALVSAFEGPELLLPRTRDDIADCITDFVVAVNRRNRIEGCAALHAYAPSLAEVGSVAVGVSAQGRGLGTLIVRGVEALARQRGIDELFAVTTVPAFFRTLGYDVTDIRAYPEKLARYAVLATRGIQPTPKTCLAKRVAA